MMFRMNVIFSLPGRRGPALFRRSGLVRDRLTFFDRFQLNLTRADSLIYHPHRWGEAKLG